MAYFQGAVRSYVMGLDTNINVILPHDYYDASGNPGKYDKVLYLLHGLKQNADAWPRMSGVERYANHYGFAVVIPEVQRSFYTDMPGGPSYFTYITEELPKLMHAMFRLPIGRENTYVGGLSMGGFGALKCALKCPDKFCGAMCFSSGFYSMEHPDRLVKAYFKPGELRAIMGDDLTIAPENDLDGLMDRYPADLQKPQLYLACGTEDFLYDANCRARDTLRAKGFDLTWEEWSGGHSWNFWDVAVERGMKLFNEMRK